MFTSANTYCVYMYVSTRGKLNEFTCALTPSSSTIQMVNGAPAAIR